MIGPFSDGLVIEGVIQKKKEGKRWKLRGCRVQNDWLSWWDKKFQTKLGEIYLPGMKVQGAPLKMNSERVFTIVPRCESRLRTSH